MTAPFDLVGRYYDLLYQDKNYEQEVAYIDRLLKRYNVSGSELLDFGSGTGRHGRLLAQLGYRVVGIERSPEMVAQASETDGFHCQQGDITSVHLGRQFDAVLSLFHVMSYQVSNAAAQAVLSRASAHLAPGGLFIFDVWYSPAVAADPPAVRVKRITSEGLNIIRIAEPKLIPSENRVDVQYSIFVKQSTSGDYNLFNEIHPMRHFSLPELDLLSASAGFIRLGAEEWLTGAEPSPSSWGICLILRKEI